MASGCISWGSHHGLVKGLTSDSLLVSSPTCDLLCNHHRTATNVGGLYVAYVGTLAIVDSEFSFVVRLIVLSDTSVCVCLCVCERVWERMCMIVCCTRTPCFSVSVWLVICVWLFPPPSTHTPSAVPIAAAAARKRIKALPLTFLPSLRWRSPAFACRTPRRWKAYACDIVVDTCLAPFSC